MGILKDVSSSCHWGEFGVSYVIHKFHLTDLPVHNDRVDIGRVIVLQSHRGKLLVRLVAGQSTTNIWENKAYQQMVSIRSNGSSTTLTLCECVCDVESDQ